MIIAITCALEDPTSNDADRLLPFLAKADFRGIEARDTTPIRAVATVQGICLHALGDFVTPPTLVRFTITFMENQPEPEPTKDLPS